ncbi:thermonuclease family protein [Thalassotalea euphylliae]|uniref:thermonuclease family protein n=1 Tax=Thalassotalea euphylliae TaxID=1655234 RepID=UPI00362D09C6
MDKPQILWSPSGTTLPSLGARALTDTSDGDTPNIRMPIRMLSIDTPEVTAKSEKGAARVDAEFKQLALWIKNGDAPVTKTFAKYIVPKLDETAAGTLQFTQGKEASAFHKAIVSKRLTKPNGTKRKLFIRSPKQPFDSYGRLLAYVSPSYSTREISSMTRRERATFNLDMLASGWAAPFILYPTIPNEADLPLFIEVVTEAINDKKGQFADSLSMPGYEYRMCEKLYDITKKLVNGESISYARKTAWRSRYCADIRSRELYQPEAYFNVPEPYRLWIWPDDIQEAIGKLNLIPEY